MTTAVTDITPLKEQMMLLEGEVETIVITNKAEYAEAIDIVSRLKDAGSKIKNVKESITKPLNEALKSARNLFAPLEDQLTCAEGIIKQKLLAYKKEVDAAAKKEEEKIARQVEAGRLKIETAERKIDTITRVENTTRGSVGQITVRIIKKVRITDESLIPRTYLMLDMVAIRRDALGGITIPGVEVYDEESLAANNNYGKTTQN